MKREEEKKVPLMLFSGGLDSTYMLQTYLEKGDVEVLYVKGSQGPDKIAKELAARRKIIKALEKKTGNHVLRDHKVELGHLFGGDMPDRGFLQAPMWIIGALQVSDHTRHSELAIGYVAGDQIACHIPYIANTWDNIQMFAKQGSIPVVFPLKVERKVDILHQIDVRAVQHVWVCEIPEWWRDGKKLHWDDGAGGTLKSCGKCAACITSAGTFHMYQKKYGAPYSHHFIEKMRNIKRKDESEELLLIEEPFAEGVITDGN